MDDNQMIPYWRQQASKLIETGKCELPVDSGDVARRVALNDGFARALEKACDGDTRMIQMLRMTAAAELCKEFDDAS